MSIITPCRLGFERSFWTGTDPSVFESARRKDTGPAPTPMWGHLRNVPWHACVQPDCRGQPSACRTVADSCQRVGPSRTAVSVSDRTEDGRYVEKSSAQRLTD